jgi:hypothetical protein
VAWLSSVAGPAVVSSSPATTCGLGIAGWVGGSFRRTRFAFCSAGQRACAARGTIDAIEQLDGEPAGEGALAGFLEAVSAAPRSRRPPEALGEDLRLAGNSVLGSGLELDGELLQLSAFPSDAEVTDTRIARPLRRDDDEGGSPVQESPRRLTARRGWGCAPTPPVEHTSPMLSCVRHKEGIIVGFVRAAMIVPCGPSHTRRWSRP